MTPLPAIEGEAALLLPGEDAGEFHHDLVAGVMSEGERRYPMRGVGTGYPARPRSGAAPEWRRGSVPDGWS